MSHYEIRVVHPCAPIPLTWGETRRICRMIDHLEKEVWKVPVYAGLHQDGVSFFKKPVEELFSDFWASVDTSERRTGK